MNIIAIKGRLVRDPECRKTPNDITTCKITVAVDRAYSNGGEKQTDFFDCVFWRQGAEFVSKYFSKGKEIIVQGEMQSRKWQDKDGINRTTPEIITRSIYFADSKPQEGSYSPYAASVGKFAEISEEDGDLPF